MPTFSNRRRVAHTADQMFDLVADVERYPEFVPLCQQLKIRQRTPGPDGTEIVIADSRRAKVDLPDPDDPITRIRSMVEIRKNQRTRAARAAWSFAKSSPA